MVDSSVLLWMATSAYRALNCCDLLYRMVYNTLVQTITRIYNTLRLVVSSITVQHIPLGRSRSSRYSDRELLQESRCITCRRTLWRIVSIILRRPMKKAELTFS